MYRLSANGAVANAPSTPQNAGIWASGGAAPVLSHPDGRQLLLFSPGTAGAIHRFTGTSWVAHGTHQIGAVQWFGVPIPDYGVVLFVGQASSVSTPIAKVYKP
jgi:hypothetical protein